MLKVALWGNMGVGKDTVCELLQEIHSEHFKGELFRLAFGDGMKLAFHTIYKDIPMNPKPNLAYVEFGTACREIDSKVWVKALNKNYVYRRDKHNYAGFIITDMRNEDELQWCVKNGFKIVKVVADIDVRRGRCGARGDREFISSSKAESEIDYYMPDLMIYNSFSNKNDLKNYLEQKYLRGVFF